MANREQDQSEDHLPTMTSSEVLELVGLYPIVRLIGQGASARVFECVDTQSPPPDRGRHVAIKVLRPELVADPARRERLRVEGERQKTIPSPYVARCYGVGEHDGNCFVVQELLKGEDLQRRLDRDGPLPVKEALRYARDVAKGLRAAWAAGVVHGDIKPANLFVDERRVKIVDFGLAMPVASFQASSASASSTTARTLLQGTPAFLAPELVWGQAPDARADFYSLGCTIFALVTGRPPFTQAAIADLLIAHASQPPPLVTTLLPQASERLVRLLSSLLAKSPADRPATHDACIALIEDALSDVVGAPGSSAPSSSPSSSPSTSPSTSPSASPSAAALDPLNVATAPSKLPGLAAAATVLSSRPLAPAPLSLPDAVPFVSPFAAPFVAGTGPSQVLQDPFAVPDSDDLAVGAPTGVVGSLKQMNVTEIVQSLEMGRKTAIVEVQPARGDKGTLACVAGAVVHARTTRLEGEAAFYDLIVHTDGFFRIHYGDEPAERNINRPTQFLVLEGLRRIDESGFDDRTALSPVEAAPFAQVPSTTPGVRPPGAVSGFDMDAPTVALPRGASADGPPPPAPVASRKAEAAAVVDEATDPGSLRARARPARAEAQAQAPQGPAGQPRQAPGTTEMMADLREVVVGAGAAISSRWASVVTRVTRALRPRLATQPGLVEALERATPTLQSPLTLAVALLLPLAIVLLVVVVVRDRPFSIDEANAAISSGDEAAIADLLEELDGVPPAARLGSQHQVRGHALRALAIKATGNPAAVPDDAIDAWRDAAAKGVVDDGALAAILSVLKVDEADHAIAALKVWPRPAPGKASVDDALRPLLGSGDWNTRHHAAMALRERGVFSEDDQDALGVIDLNTGDTCLRRQQGLVLLQEAGRSKAAIAAIDEAGRTRKGDNSCLAPNLPAAARAVVQRSARPR